MKRYRKKYFCVCDGQQEEMYLKHVSQLLSNFPSKVVQFDTTVAAPTKMEKFYQDYDRAALFDYDFNDQQFKTNIETCDILNKKYGPGPRKAGQATYHAYSNVNFDLWLILHKEDYNRSVTSNNAYVNDLRRIYGLGDNDNIKKESVIEIILKNIQLNDVKNAIKRADSIRAHKLETDKMIAGNTEYYNNPDFSIHAFLRKVLNDSGETL